MINHQRPTGLKALSLEIKDNYLLKFGYLNQLFHTYLTLTGHYLLVEISFNNLEKIFVLITS